MITETNVLDTVTEYITHKFVEKRDKINVKAIVYEGVVGRITLVIGDIGEAAKTVKWVKSTKIVVKFCGCVVKKQMISFF